MIWAASGRAALKEFVGKPIRASVTRDEVLLRIFFGNFANKKTMKRELAAYAERIGKVRAYMEATEARVTAHPGAKHAARRYQLLSLRIKVAQIRAMEQELARFLAVDRAKVPPNRAPTGNGRAPPRAKKRHAERAAR